MSNLELQTKLAELHRDLDTFAGAAVREREERLRGLQLAARSLRQAESTAQWVEILADAAAPLASVVCFFRVDGSGLRAEAARGMEVPSASIDLADAPAFRQAVETRETVVSLFTPSQLGALGEVGTRRRVHLFPLTGKRRVLGVMLALDDAGPDVYGIEVLLSLGAASLELRETAGTGLVALGIGGAPSAPVAEVLSARRFARTTVARWILTEGNAVAAGRAGKDLYGAMREFIDAARADYARQYMPGPDHLHGEMVRTLALGKPALLGSGYPGEIGGGGGR